MNQSITQTAKAPSTPKAVANGSKSISYSEAETSKSYAFSCAFKEVFLSKIKELIIQSYPDFNEKIHSKSEEFELKIELKKNEIKLEFKSFKGQVSDDMIKIKSIAFKIKKFIAT